MKETERSAEILGVQRVEWLGYTDSGMMGTPENDLDGSFWTADVEEAAERLATILRDEEADVLTIYDSDGNYGHPDHIQVHRVGLRAAELAGTARGVRGHDQPRPHQAGDAGGGRGRVSSPARTRRRPTTSRRSAGPSR